MKELINAIKGIEEMGVKKYMKHYTKCFKNNLKENPYFEDTFLYKNYESYYIADFIERMTIIYIAEKMVEGENIYIPSNPCVDLGIDKYFNDDFPLPKQDIKYSFNRILKNRMDYYVIELGKKIKNFYDGVNSEFVYMIKK